LTPAEEATEGNPGIVLKHEKESAYAGSVAAGASADSYIEVISTQDAIDTVVKKGESVMSSVKSTLEAVESVFLEMNSLDGLAANQVDSNCFGKDQESKVDGAVRIIQDSSVYKDEHPQKHTVEYTVGQHGDLLCRFGSESTVLGVLS
jgi:hypothetical protein